MNAEDFFYQIYQGLPQAGPGSDASSQRALALIPDLPERPRIIDFGCGPGRSSLLLARAAGGSIVAIDNHRPFVETLQRRARQCGLSDHIIPIVADMAAPPLAAESADLIWSEGAVYFLGFTRGLRQWRKFLRSGGCVAVSEATWLTPNPSPQTERFWRAEYPAMQSVDANVMAMRGAGYEPLATFALPKDDWFVDYYRPLRTTIAALRTAHPDNPEARKVADGAQAEIDLWVEHGDEYGYVFYIGRKS